MQTVTRCYKTVCKNYLSWSKTQETYKNEIFYAPFSQLTWKYIFFKKEVGQRCRSYYKLRLSYAFLCTLWALYVFIGSSNRKNGNHSFFQVNGNCFHYFLMDLLKSAYTLSPNFLSCCQSLEFFKFHSYFNLISKSPFSMALHSRS